jgi:hypothetical protein
MQRENEAGGSRTVQIKLSNAMIKYLFLRGVEAGSYGRSDIDRRRAAWSVGASPETDLSGAID